LCSGLKDYPNCQVIHKDILDFDLRKLKGRFKVFGNIPYYISTPIIERLLQYRNKFDAAYLTVQKEFAERITAPAGTKAYGSLSCFVQYYFAPKIMLQIKKTCFYPAPKVDSCLIRLETRRQPCVRVRDEALFFKLIRSAFNQRRKTLRNSLRELASARALREFYNRYNIDVNIRPERLGLGDFANLADILAEKRQKKS
jgi:16S rRNA (adenine1518-N6/adenine1519-N6)-dimethyltransferase